MLFYAKKHLLLELGVAVLLGGAGVLGIRHLQLPVAADISLHVLIWGTVGAAALTAWTLLVQRGYALVKGEAHATALTTALASHFGSASTAQIAGGLCAAACEEIFFRGFIQGRFGLLAGAVTFMIAHIGGRDIRVIGYWSVFQGLGLGLLYSASGNLLAPMMAHGLFDMGAMVYFRAFMASRMRCAS